MEIAFVVLGVVALGLGGGLVWSVRSGHRAQREVVRLGHELETARDELDREREGHAREKVRAEASSARVVEQSEEIARLGERLESAEKRYQDLVNDEKRLKEQFGALSAETIKHSQETLGKYLSEHLKRADQVAQGELDKRKQAVEAMVKPIAETLGKTREQLTALDERVRASGESSAALKDETARLAKALSRPEIRGRYGEIQLRRVAELAGMVEYCDFDEQFSGRDAEGSLQRPDMVVTLPNERMIAVDAKTNTHAYLEAIDAGSAEERERHLDRFARHVADQAKKLGDKKYWDLFERSPEFVVMFVPGDHFIDAALSRQPTILEDAATRGVILASPSTLIGLLRAVAVGWHEHRLSEQAEALFELGKELHERASVAFEHAGKLGDSIRQSVERYNKLVGSIDSRLMPTLKKFEESGAKSAKALSEPKPLDAAPRALEAGGGAQPTVGSSDTEAAGSG